MQELDQIKVGWVSMKDAARISGVSRPNLYYYIRTRPAIRTRYVEARRQIRIDDLLNALGRGKEDEQ